MSRIRDALREWRPSSVTGGAPFYPLFVLFGLYAVQWLDVSAFGLLAPEIQDSFRLDIQGILTLVSLVSVAGVILQVPIAYLADRSNRVVIAIAGAAMWGLFSLLTGLAPTLLILAIARAGSGLGDAVTVPTHNSLLADYYDVSVRPKVFGFHRAAYSLGLFVGPAVAGILAYRWTWRVPFVVFSIPTMIFVFLALRLREPLRGGKERQAMGASDEIVQTEEAATSFAEAWRILWQIRALRRIWYSLPFLATAFYGFASLLSIYYEQIYGLDEAQRGLIFALAEPAGIVGLLLAVPVTNRLMSRDPGLGIRFLSLVLVITAGTWIVFVIAPTLAVSIVGQVIVAGLLAVIAPSILAALSLALPPRVRSLGFTVGALWYLPGLLLLIAIGALADEWGVRPAISLMIPTLLVGAAVIWSAARFLSSDILRVRTSSVALSEVAAARKQGHVKLLLVKGLDVGYDGVQVLFGVDLEVDEGEIVALLGTNGAGKSTLLRSISGLVEAQAGAIVFDGRDMTYAPPHEIVPRGVVQVPGGGGVFPTLSVAENLRIAGWLYRRRDPKHIAEATQRVLEYFPVLRERADQAAGSLSGGEQQMLTLGMAFVAKPRLLMIDELSLGLAPVIVEQLLQIVRAIREQGTTIILVEQSVNLALTIAETAYFMEKGEIRFHGPTRELLERPDVLRSVFLEGAASVSRGNGAKTAKKSRVKKAGAPVLEVAGVRKSFGGITAVDGVDLMLREGQILGVIGPNGAGKTTLFDLVSGFLAPDGGSIVLAGTDVTRAGPDRRSRLGLGRSFQDARLFPALSVSDAIALALHRWIDVTDPVAAVMNLPAVAKSERHVSERVEELIELMGLEAFRDKFISELSTGSRRIVDLACTLAHQPKVLLFDEPSSGIAQREAEALAPLLLRIRDATGASLLVIEHDMPLVTSVSDEIVALDLGRVVTQGPPQDVVNHPAVVESYLGSSREAIARSGELAGPKRRKTPRTGASSSKG